MSETPNHPLVENHATDYIDKGFRWGESSMKESQSKLNAKFEKDLANVENESDLKKLLENAVD